jgi:hypothetical protein
MFQSKSGTSEVGRMTCVACLFASGMLPAEAADSTGARRAERMMKSRRSQSLPSAARLTLSRFP